MTDPQDKPNVEERYTSAANTSNLAIVAEKGGPGDVIIAAGWSRSQLGAALLRLHSEWDGAQKPVRPDPANVKKLADRLEAEFDRKPDGEKPRRNRFEGTAARMAGEWYRHELGLLFGQLKTLPSVRAGLMEWATEQGLDAPEALTAKVLAWWTDHTCPVCQGQRWRVIPETGRLSDRQCECCHGSGETPIPGGQNGRRMLGEMEECMQAARTSMTHRLRRSMGRGEAKKPPAPSPKLGTTCETD